MADRELELLIKLRAELAGARSAEEALEKVREAIKGVKDESSDYDAWLKKNAAQLGEVSQASAAASAEAARYQQVLEQMAQTQILESAQTKEAVKLTQSFDAGLADTRSTLSQLEKNLGTTTDATTKLGLSKKNLRDILKVIPGELRAIGSSLMAAFSNPIVAAVAGMVLIVKLASEAFKMLKRDIEVIEMANLREGFDATSAAAARAATSTEEFDEALKNLQTRSQAQDAESSQRLAVLRAEKEAADKVAEADKRRALAKATTPAERERIEANFAHGQLSRDQGLRDAELTERRELLGRKGVEAETLTKELSAAEQAVYDTTRKHKDLEGMKANAETAIAELDKKIKSHDASTEDVRQFARYSSSLGLINAQLESADVERASSTRNRDRLRSQLTGVSGQITSLQGEVATGERVNAIRSGAENTVANLDRGTRNVGSVVGRAAVAAMDLASPAGRVQDSDNASALNQLAAQLQIKNNEQKAFLQMLRNFLADGVVTDEEGRQLRQQIAQLRAQGNRHPQ